MNRSRLLLAAMLGCTLVVIPLVIVALVVIDKGRFGGLVGSYFLQIVMSGIFFGALMLLVSAWSLHEARNWRGRTLIAWALVALTSPAFGWMFIAPWMLLTLTVPVVISALVSLWRERAGTAPLPAP
jgi:MFS family permease